MNRQRAYLWLGLSVSVAATVLSLLGAPPWLRLWFGLPVVLLIPGYALTHSMDPRTRLGGPERFALSVGGSIAVTVMSGLVLAASPAGLHRTTWIAGLSLFSILTTLLALQRTRGLRFAARQPGLAKGGMAVLGQSATVLVLTATLAVSLASAAATSTLGSEHSVEQGEASVLQLWALPQSAESGELLVGIDNPGASALVGTVRIRHGRMTASEMLVVLAAQESRTIRVQRDAFASIMFPTEITLLGRDGSVLRRVNVWPAREGAGGQGEAEG